MVGIISIILAVLIPVTVWVWKSFVTGPELTIELIKTGSQSLHVGFSNKNIPIDRVIDMRDAIQIFELQWIFEIIIRNNSEHTAYNPKISFSSNQSPFLRLDKLNELIPIASKGEIKINAVYQELEESKGRERNNMASLPTDIDTIRIMLKYKNSSKSAFYTVYNNVNKSNCFFRKRLKGFKY